MVWVFGKDILKEASWVKENWKFRIGNGSEVRFWTDIGVGPQLSIIPTLPFLR